MPISETIISYHVMNLAYRTAYSKDYSITYRYMPELLSFIGPVELPSDTITLACFLASSRKLVFRHRVN